MNLYTVNQQGFYFTNAYTDPPLQHSLPSCLQDIAHVKIGQGMQPLHKTSENSVHENSIQFPEQGVFSRNQGTDPPLQDSLTSCLQDFAQQLAVITGFDKVSLQPNSGAAGEYAGLMAIRGFHKSNKEEHRNICIIPTSAHGTNPASAVMAGMKVVTVGVDKNGNIDVGQLKKKCEEHKDK